MARWPALRDGGWLSELPIDRHAVAFWTRRFDEAYNGRGSWESAWVFTCWQREGLCILPEVNLVTNIGFGWDAPASAESMFADMRTRAVQFPLVHPSMLSADRENDTFIEDVVFSGNQARLLGRIRRAHRMSGRSPALAPIGGDGRAEGGGLL